MRKFLALLYFIPTIALAHHSNFEHHLSPNFHVEGMLALQTSINDFDGKYIEDSTRFIGDAWFKAGNFTASLTLDTENNPLEEAFVAYDFKEFYGDGFYPRVSFGISDAYYGFYSFTDSIASSSMTVLPQGVYAYDFIKGGFAKINGYSVSLISNNLADKMFFIELEYAKGKPVIDSYDLYEMSMFDGELNDNVDLDEDFAEAIALTVNWKDKITVFGTKYTQQFDLKKQNPWVFPKDLYSYFYYVDKTWWIDIDRYGLQFLIDKYEFTYEHYELDVNNGTFKDIPGSSGGYFTIQYFADVCTFTTGYSRAIADSAGSKEARDYFIGVVVPYDNHTFGAEVHHGKGPQWAIENNEDDLQEWNSLVLSYTYKF